MTRRIADLLEYVTIASLLVTLVSGMILGSGVSATARGVFLALVGVTCLVSGFAMLFAGRWRIVRSLLWLPLFLFLCLGALQITPTVQAYLPENSLNGGDVISASRHATLQMTIWLSGGIMLAFVVGSQIRTTDRLSVATGVLTLSLWVVGLVGFGQTLLGRPQLAGFISPDDPKVPAIIHDIYGADSAHGLVAYGSWMQTSSGDVSLFVPKAAAYRYFGGFLDAKHWAACVMVLVPMLLAMCVHLAGYAGVGGWRTHGQTQQSWLLWTVGLCMSGTAAWMGDPVVVPTVLTASLLITVFWMGPDERKRAFFPGMAYLAVMAGICAAYLSLIGVPPFLERFQAWLSDSQSLREMLEGHWLFGIGLGSTGDVWPMYRSHSATVGHEGSSLLALAAEIGVVGSALIGVMMFYVLIASFAVYSRLDQDGRVALAGSWGGLVGLLLFGAFGPALDLPVVLGLAIFALACLMRALAGGFRNEEALLAV